MKKMVLVVCAVVMLAGVSFATTPIKLSFWDKTAAPLDDSVHGFELGIGTITPEIVGVGWNILYVKTVELVGWKVGAVTDSLNVLGAQTGIFNINRRTLTGAQIGFFNKAESVIGVQLGFVNITDDIYGVQIGIINNIKSSENLPWMIFANAKF